MARYAILSDIHANLEALDAVLDVCDEMGVDQYLCLGDIVGYNANPRECLHLVWGLNLMAIVRGNHDEYVASNDMTMEGFNPNARAAVLWTRQQITEEERSWLGTPPLRMSVPGSPMTLVHATLDSPDQWGYVFDAHHAKDNFSYLFTQICFCGHSHVPVAFDKRPMISGPERQVLEIREWAFPDGEGEELDPYQLDAISVQLEPGHRYLFNIGSIGQPRNHDPRSSFAIYDSNEKTVTRFRVPYDIATAQQKVLDAGLPERLALRLATGS